MIATISRLITPTLLVSLLLAPGLSWSVPEAPQAEGPKAAAAASQADFLFVQNARAIHFADGNLTLKGVSHAAEGGGNSLGIDYVALKPVAAEP